MREADGLMRLRQDAPGLQYSLEGDEERHRLELGGRHQADLSRPSARSARRERSLSEQLMVNECSSIFAGAGLGRRLEKATPPPASSHCSRCSRLT